MALCDFLTSFWNKIISTQEQFRNHQHPIPSLLQSYSVTRETSGSEGRGVYFTLAFAGLALMMAMVVGIVVLRRRNNSNPHNQVCVLLLHNLKRTWTVYENVGRFFSLFSLYKYIKVLLCYWIEKNNFVRFRIV